MNALLDTLNGLKMLLEKEKKALIKNDGSTVQNIVLEKESIAKRLSNFENVDPLNNEKIKKIVKEIKELQETNLLLTKQALSFQLGIMDSILESVKSNSNTYSEKGTYDKNKGASFIDKSF